MAATHTVVLGAGFGGISTALTLRKRLPGEHRITLVDKSDLFVVGAAQTWVMTGKAALADISAPRAQLRNHGVDCLFEEIKHIDPVSRSVVTASQTLRADYLVIALGAVTRMDRIDGLAQAAETFYTPGGAAQLHHRLTSMSSGRIVVLIPATPFKCPPAPYEAALTLHAQLLQQGLRQRVQLALYSVEPAPMATAGPPMGEFLKGLLAEAGIPFAFSRKTQAVDATQKLIHFSDGAREPFDLLIAIPPHEAPPVVREAGLLAESGWIPVHPATSRTKLDRVWAVGDIASFPLPGRFKPDAPLVLPKAGVFAAAQGRSVATQIAADVLGGDGVAFDGTGFCFIETGGEHAVRGQGDFYATPHPNVTPSGPPDKAQLEEKRRWVRDWLSLSAMPEL